MKVLVLDNYDSFTYNLVQYLGELGADPVAVRNDALAVGEARALAPDRLLISPGPGRPEDAGLSVDYVRELGAEVPTLGVCLGFQAVAAAYGGTIVPATRPRHGMTSEITHDGAGVFLGLPNPFTATRYHSLAVGDLPKGLVVTARSEDGVIQGIRHRDHPVEGVQFHPESVMTEHGKALLSNFLERQTQPRRDVTPPPP